MFQLQRVTQNWISSIKMPKLAQLRIGTKDYSKTFQETFVRFSYHLLFTYAICIVTKSILIHCSQKVRDI